MHTKPAVHRLRLTPAVAEKLRQHHLAPGKRAESISLAMGHGYSNAQGHVTLVLSDPEALVMFADDCYETKGHAHAVLRKDVRAAAMWQALQDDFTAVVDVHDHHFADTARFSGVDDNDDENTRLFFEQTVPQFLPPRERGPLFAHAAALLLARDEWAARVVWAPQTPFAQALQVQVPAPAGMQWLCAPPATLHGEGPARLVRQAPVLGHAVMQRLGGLRVAVVGAGGTGSITAEMLGRLGVGQIDLIDADRVEASNLNRLQGAGPGDVGEFKVDVMRRELGRCSPDVQVHSVADAVWSAAAVECLEQADMVIGCVDNEHTRWWLNRFAVQYLIPYFDVGVLVQLVPVRRTLSRVTTVVPGAGPCGHCSPMDFFHRSRPARFLDAATLATQRRAGYVQDTSAMVADPSLYMLNLEVVAALGMEMLAWLTADGRGNHSTVRDSNEEHLQRLPRALFGGLHAEDCAVCTTLMGACRTVPLPEEQSDDQAVNHAAEIAAAFETTSTRQGE